MIQERNGGQKLQKTAERTFGPPESGSKKDSSFITPLTRTRDRGSEKRVFAEVVELVDHQFFCKKKALLFSSIFLLAISQQEKCNHSSFRTF